MIDATAYEVLRVVCSAFLTTTITPLFFQFILLFFRLPFFAAPSWGKAVDERY